MRTLVLMALLVLAPVVASAQEEGASLQMMIEQQQALRDDLATGVQGITPRQTRVIRKAQDEFFRIVAGRATLDELSIEDKIRIENALESINAQIVNTSASRSGQNVCWRETRVGSGKRVTRCGTEEERTRLREGARDYLARPRICSGPGCG